MLKLRYSTRFLLVMLALCGVGFAVCRSFHDYHRAGAEREIEAIEKYALDIYGYETDSFLPAWASRWLPSETQRDFEHITEIDLQFNDLSVCDPKDVIDLHACAWVQTLRVPNATMTQEMFDAVVGFPRLREIYVRDWFERSPSHAVSLETGVAPGIKIILE